MNHARLLAAVLFSLLLGPVWARSDSLNIHVDSASNSMNTGGSIFDYDHLSLCVYWQVTSKSSFVGGSSEGQVRSPRSKKSFDHIAEKSRDARAYTIFESANNPGMLALAQYHLRFGNHPPMLKNALYVGQIIRQRDYQLIQAAYGRLNSRGPLGVSDQTALGIIFAGNLAQEISRQIRFNLQVGYRKMQPQYWQDRLGSVIMLNRSIIRKFSTGTFGEFSLSYRLFGQ